MSLEDSGYLYVLVNPLMEGLVKIGKTTRDPQDRVHELSSATGVPTPFILIYQEYFDDCSAAEIKVHQILESKNFRVSNNREFFKLPPYEAIHIIQNVKKDTIVFDNSNIDNTKIVSKTNNEQISKLGDDLLNEGIKCYLGKEEIIQDYNEAISFFNKALKLGNVSAYKYLGILRWLGQGCKRNYDKAIENLKKGANLGEYHCYALLGMIFIQEQKLYYEENSYKSWKCFFNSLSNKITDIDTIYILEYLITFNNLDLDMQFINNIIPIKRQLLEYIEMFDKQFPIEIKDEVKVIRENLNQYFKTPFKSFKQISSGDMLFHKTYGAYTFIGEEQLIINDEPENYYLLKNLENKSLYLKEDTETPKKLQVAVLNNNLHFYKSLKEWIESLVD